jgi:hypothetical protein
MPHFQTAPPPATKIQYFLLGKVSNTKNVLPLGNFLLVLEGQFLAGIPNCVFLSKIFF